MIKNLLFACAIVFASCKISSFSQNLQGSYFKEGKDYKYRLKLNNDSSFIFIREYFEANSTCRGKWQFISKDTVLLVCDDVDLSEKLQRGYMTTRERKVIVMNNSRLKIDNVILKRLSKH